MLMFLKCHGCEAVQPVTIADEADEDPRTRAIRRTFRAEHDETCGDGAVTLVTVDRESQPADNLPSPAWMSAVPAGVRLSGDGFFTTTILRDGASMDVRVCEDCWQPMPRYLDFPMGLTSPESDAKVRRATVEGKAGIEHLRKAVCLPCYVEAFGRVYPTAPRPEFRDEVFGDRASEARVLREHATVIDGGTAGEPDR